MSSNPAPNQGSAPDPNLKQAGVQSRRAEGNTLAAVIQRYTDEGDIEQFEHDEQSVLCDTCQTRSPASAVMVYRRNRLEGASNPDDMLIVFGIVCPSCEARGPLVLGFGPNAAAEDQDLIGELAAAAAAFEAELEHGHPDDAPSS